MTDTMTITCKDGTVWIIDFERKSVRIIELTAK